MEKNFDTWNEQKKFLNSSQRKRFYNEREIWWCTLGVNIGTEEDGTSEEFRRPVLIVKAMGPHACVVLPLTTSQKVHYLRLGLGTVAGKEAKALLSQIRTIDTKRLVRKIEFISEPLFKNIRKALRDLF